MNLLKRKKQNIEIIGIGSNSVYSIGKIIMTKKGDVYLISKTGDNGSHTSRHRDGEFHICNKKEKSYQHIEKRIDTNMKVAFNLCISLLTESGIPKLMNTWKDWDQSVQYGNEFGYIR